MIQTYYSSRCPRLDVTEFFRNSEIQAGSGGFRRRTSRLHRCLQAAAESPVAVCTPTHSTPRSRSSRICRSIPSVAASIALMSISSLGFAGATCPRSVSAASAAARMMRRSRASFRAKSASTRGMMVSSRAQNRRERPLVLVGEIWLKSNARIPTVRSMTHARRATERRRRRWCPSGHSGPTGAVGSGFVKSVRPLEEAQPVGHRDPAGS